MRCRLQMFIDCDVALPLIDKPIAHAKFETEFFHLPIERIEVLVVQHARRHMDGVPLIPVVPLAADLGVTVAFQRVKVGFWMGMTVALGVRQIDEDRADRYARRLEAVVLTASSHQEIGSPMF